MAHRLGFVSQTTMHYTDAVPAAQAMELDFLELMLDGHHARGQLDPDSLRVALADTDLDMLVHLPFTLDIGSPHEHVREGAIAELEANLEMAAQFDAEKAVVHASSNAWRPAWDEDTVQDHIVDSLGELDDTAADHGIELCVENLRDQYFGLEEFERLFAETDASMTFDTGHAYIEGYDSAAQREWLADHADRVSHVHVNDTRKQEDEHIPVGSGFLDFGRILDPLDDVTLSLEVFTPAYEYVGLSAQTLRREVEGLGDD